MAKSKAPGATGAGTTVTAGNRRRVQARRERKDGFGAARRQVFLDHLAACCNVTRAAHAAGTGMTTAYEARRRDPGFAQAWDEAMDTGYATLEALLVERAALGGAYQPGDTPVPGPETVDPGLALDLLRLRGAAKAVRRPGGARPRRATEQETTEAILAGLAILRRRQGRR